MRGKRILIIDDDALIRVQVVDALKEAEPDLVVEEAEDGEVAIGKLDHFAPDLILLDLFMPTLSGIETLSFIRARPNPPRVVIMSSLDSDVMKADLMKQGAEGFIPKPFHPIELADAVRRYLA